MCILNTYKISIIEKGTTIGEKLIYHRKLNNLTQEALSKIIGVEASSIKDIEKGRRLPGRKISQKLASYFKLDTKYFYDQYLEDTDNVSILLKKYRSKNKFTIRQAASKFNISPSAWSMWESESNNISRCKYEQLKKLGLI
ncbi:helix-turn-helix domain-containing protein [Clostridium cagae]|uniref:helix-turn-helix domain-containing protein n=1 Tax=Clostridium cagae TaxID=2080751 RepID=UPI003F7723BD